MNWGSGFGGGSNPATATGPASPAGPSIGSGVKKLHYIGIFKKTDAGEAVKLCADAKLDEYGRFTRNSAGEMLTLLARTTAKTSPDGQHRSVDLSSDDMFQGKAVKMHSWARVLQLPSGQQVRVVGVVITEGWPKDLAAHQLLKRVVEDFLVATPLDAIEDAGPTDADLQMPAPQPDPAGSPEPRSYLELGQDPNNFDAMARIQDQLDETKIILSQTIESVLQRGEKIDDLVQKSDNLSLQSKMFYKQAKKTNSCCVLM